MTPFDIAVNDIFTSADFLEPATISGVNVSVIASEIAEFPSVGEFGLDSGVSFFLRLLVSAMPSAPKQNDSVIFRGNSYRIESVTLDSSGLAWRINLKSTSSR